MVYRKAGTCIFCNRLFVCDCTYISWPCACVGSSLEVKIETDSNDAMEIKTEADSNECLHYDRQIIGMFVIFHVLLSLFLCQQ